MYISMVHIYRSDANGFYEEEFDFITEIILLDMLVEDKLHELSILDNIMDDLPTGAYITIEAFVMKYVHFVDETDEESVSALLSTVTDEMEDMIDDESLLLLESFTSTVQVKDSNELNKR